MKLALILPAVVVMLDSGMSASGQIPGFPDGRPLQMSPASPTPSQPTPAPSKPIPNEAVIEHHLRRHHPARRTRPGLQSATVTFAAPPHSGTIRDKSGSTKYRFPKDSSGNTVYRDNSGRRVFSIDKSGTVRDNSDRSVFTISNNGTVRDSSGRREGQFTTDSMGTTTFRDNSGRTKYRIQKNGDIRDSSGRLMGKIQKR